ncbi:hypothetical protein [Collimonas sp.]|jgi:hypothetical protein|uniref:hypothetical protein n=1 Tax=Collimonas sp. TaxID=1963772 RepID=UPI002C2F87CD|nr:hypothetical protein [Collimonas sp.]HWW07792.1 hypothetical protein [Collimonas sp.]
MTDSEKDRARQVVLYFANMRVIGETFPSGSASGISVGTRYQLGAVGDLSSIELNGGKLLSTEGSIGANTIDSVEARIQELVSEGHGVQRHGADVTGQQLTGRAVEGLDPMTGTRVDGVHGGAHQYAQHATQVVSDEAYAFAENYARNSQQFVDATSASTTGRAQVQIPLQEIFGNNFRDYVTGVTRYGPKSAPLGSGNTTFGNDAYMVTRYKQGANGDWKFNTMLPQPD